MDKEDVCVHTAEYYSAMKMDKIMLLAATWLDIEVIILSEISQRRINTIGCHLHV